MQVNANAMMSISNWMNNSANNIANVNTQDYSATQTTMNNNGSGVVAQSSQTGNRTDLAKEMTDQISIEKSVDANAQAIKTQDKMIGSLLDLTI
ncbi:MAG: flagellar basal body rod C-terminal domain-containing protein [Sulfurospirillaceae bacterium]|nr:flagellar basal body rod C-terminal domain-containing protein [Sulfurospirillaceae bacterium]MDD2825777.1 flagellar basal body rod C-terminal domain-containing protein [Sulfurospirillaceae bacterium]